MALHFPPGCNYLTFYTQCRQKKIAISSKYAGVFIKQRTPNARSNSRNLHFEARIELNGERFVKSFDFTEKGELEAHKWYLMKKEHATETRGNYSKKLFLK